MRVARNPCCGVGSARRIPALIGDAKDVLLKLYDADAEYSADALEGIYDKLESVSMRVLRQEVDDQAAGEALSAIAREEDLNGRIRRNVMDTRRAVSFMMRSRMLNAEQFEELRQGYRFVERMIRTVRRPRDRAAEPAHIFVQPRI